MACIDVHCLWKEFFRDPSQFWDNRISKRSARSPDFRHKQTQKPLWIHGGHNPRWVRDKLRRLGVLDGDSSSPQNTPNGVALTLEQKLHDRPALMGLIKACSMQQDLRMGSFLHASILEKGLLRKDKSLGNALLSMYTKCGALSKAQEMLDTLPARNVVTWNAMIAGYAQHGLGHEALSCFQRMQDEGVCPNAVTYLCILKACGSIRAFEKGEEIHAEIGRLGLLRSDLLLGTALVDMYVNCGDLVKAQEAFDELPSQDVASWTALIDGYAAHGLGDDALSCFAQMQDKGFTPNAVTYLPVLKACSSVGATEKGKEIHIEACEQGLLENDILLSTALVDMYAKCGMLLKAQELFDALTTRDVATWTALMAGYAQVGEAQVVFDLFNRSVGEGIKPNVVTFIVLLTACSHTGLLEEGQAYFDTMSSVYFVSSTVDHHNCMVDLFSRAGHFDKALSMIERVPSSYGLRLWWTLMGACEKWVNVELGRWAFKHAMELDGSCPAAYVCMRNMFSAS